MTNAKTFTIPAWAKPAKADRFTLFETFALLGIEGQWVRLSAADQRAIIGAPVFGKLAFRVNEDGTVDATRTACFGMDYEQQGYDNTDIQGALAQGKRLCPSTYGPGIYSRAS